MDFIEKLPLSQGFDTILVVVDKFSKYTHFITLRHPFTALTVAQAFIDNVYKLHRMLQNIISDRDKVFTSQLWQNLFKLADATLNLSSAYHAQIDGQDRMSESILGVLSTLFCSFQSEEMVAVASVGGVLVQYILPLLGESL